MKQFILKKVIKNHENIKDSFVREKYGILAGVIGIITNLILVIAKIIIGFISGSVSILADGINNLSDCASNIVTVVGFKLSNKKADDDHPFGHRRIEYIAGLIISVIIMMIGVNLLIEAIGKIFNSDVTEFNIIIVIVLFISILIKLYQGSWYFFLGKKIDSISLKSSGRDSLNDVISTIAVLISAVVSIIWKINIDAYIGILVSIFIIVSGIKLIKESSDPLIGDLPSKELVDDMLKILLKEELILGYHDLVIHSYGPNTYYSTIHLEFDHHENILVIHELIDQLEKVVNEELGIILTVHMDPVVINDIETNSLKEKVIEYLKSINPLYNLHDFRLVKGIKRTNVLFDCTIDEDCNKEELRKNIETFLKNIHSKYNLIVVFEKEFRYKEKKE